MTENINAHLPRNLEQAKKRAYAIKDRLSDLGHSVGLSHVFEALALACGMRNWNTFQNALKSGADWDDDQKAETTPPSVTHDLSQFRTPDDKLWPAPYPPKHVDFNFAPPGRGRAYRVPTSVVDAVSHLDEIRLICEGGHSARHDVNWDQKDAEECLHAIQGHVKTIVRILEDATPAWRPIKLTPASGGPYVIGGYVNDGTLSSFQWAFASLTLTVDGPEWRHLDQSRAHIPIEYWTDMPAHPKRNMTNRVIGTI